MNADRLLAHYEQIADAPDAIARLRRFILDLAVRGKLVPQDPKNEPVEHALRAVRAERDELIRTNFIRREKPLAPIRDDEPPFDVPATWTWTRIGEAALFTQYGTSAKASPSERGVSVLTMGNIQDGLVVWSNEKRMPEDSDELPDLFLKKFDLLYNRTNSAELVGKTGIYLGEDNCRTFASYLIRLRFSLIHSSPRYANLAMNAPSFRESQVIPLIKKQTGQANVNGTALKNMLIPLPPLAEQHRIVAKVDELMALCDRLEEARTVREATRDRLSAASLARLNVPDPQTFQADTRFAFDALPALTARPDQIKQLRQTIVNLAVRGRLAEQDPKDEPAAELLRRIAKERTGPQEIKKGRRNGETEISSLQAHTPLPMCWRWTNIDEIALSMRYGTSTKCEYGAPGVPVLRIPNVSGGLVSLDDIKFGPLTENEIRDLALSAGDVLLIRSNGSLDIVGRSAVVTAEAEGMAFAGYLVRLRLSLTNMNPQYVRLALNSTDVRDQIERPIRSAVGLKNVNLTEFGALTFPLPPLAEQHRIVAKVDELMALCDRLEKNLNTAGSTRRRLFDALLAEALAPAEASKREAAE
jgi:type I restriction enzyme S subunit